MPFREWLCIQFEDIFREKYKNPDQNSTLEKDVMILSKIIRDYDVNFCFNIFS